MRPDELSPAQRARRARVRAHWTPPPGPLPAGPGGDPSLIPGSGETLDALCGEWRIFQRRDGHRYSTDDLLTAWYACRLAADTGLSVQRYLDLGSGIGSVAMMVAWKLPQTHVVAIEAQTLSADLMARSIRYNGLHPRAELRRGDLRDPALLPEGSVFDLVTGSPPYFVEGEAVESHMPQRGPCRFEHRGGMEGYLEAGARALAPHGLLVLVHLFAVRARMRELAHAQGLQLQHILPIVFLEGRPPHIALYALRRVVAAPAGGSELEPLVIRTLAHQRSPAYREARQWMGFPP